MSCSAKPSNADVLCESIRPGTLVSARQRNSANELFVSFVIFQCVKNIIGSAGELGRGRQGRLGMDVNVTFVDKHI